jgi:putative transposase
MGKRHSPAFKAKIVAEALNEENTITQIASEHEIHPNQISAWKAAALIGLPSLFERVSKVATEHAAHQQLDELYSQIGRLTTQNE